MSPESYDDFPQTKGFIEQKLLDGPQRYDVLVNMLERNTLPHAREVIDRMVENGSVQKTYQELSRYDVFEGYEILSLNEQPEG